MYQFAVLALATFWAWETVRFIWEQYAPGSYSVARPIQPLVVAAIAVAAGNHYDRSGILLGLAVAGFVGILHVVVQWIASRSPTNPVAVPLRRPRAGLPPLP